MFRLLSLQGQKETAWWINISWQSTTLHQLGEPQKEKKNHHKNMGKFKDHMKKVKSPKSRRGSCIMQTPLDGSVVKIIWNTSFYHSDFGLCGCRVGPRWTAETECHQFWLLTWDGINLSQKYKIYPLTFTWVTLSFPPSSCSVSSMIEIKCLCSTR